MVINCTLSHDPDVEIIFAFKNRLDTLFPEIPFQA